MESLASSNVPGTVHLVDLNRDMRAAHLKGKEDVVLVPAPSADPEDPLNWSFSRKLVTVSCAYVYISGIGFAAASIGSVLSPLSVDKDLTFTQLNLGTGLTFLFLGWSCLLWQPIALVYGRRGVYLLSTLLSIIPLIWAIYLPQHSPGQWYANRILLGIFASPSESLPEVTIPDLFFAHNRGLYMGLYAFIVFGSNFVAPLCSGFIYTAGGWQWVMWFGVISLGFTFFYCFFLMEETMYFRRTIEGVSSDTAELSTHTSAQDAETVLAGKEADPFASTMARSNSSAPGQHYPPPKTYIQKLGFFTLHPDRPSHKQHFQMMYRPFLIIIFFPCTAWSGLLYGTSLSWYNVMNATMSMVLTAAPYNFSPNMVGVGYVSPLIGSAVAWIWSGFYADKMALWFARRNGGIREPEHRLWSLLVSGFAAPAGLILWGVGAADHVHWIGILIGLGIMTFSLVCGSATALSYNVDCFKELGGETLISVIIIRNTLGFGFSYAITPWIDNQGLKKTFIAVGMISLVTMLTFLIMVLVGKRLRRFSAPRYYRYITTTVGPSH